MKIVRENVELVVLIVAAIAVIVVAASMGSRARYSEPQTMTCRTVQVGRLPPQLECKIE